METSSVVWPTSSIGSLVGVTIVLLGEAAVNDLERKDRREDRRGRERKEGETRAFFFCVLDEEDAEELVEASLEERGRLASREATSLILSASEMSCNP